MLFASLILERKQLDLAGLPAAFVAWLRDAGVLAAFGIVVFLIAFALQRRWVGKVWTTRDRLFAALAAASFASYAGFGLLLAIQGPVRTPRPPNPGNPNVPVVETDYNAAQNNLLTAAGALALLAVAVPILVGVFGALKWRRIWALAVLSIKEARAKGIFWLCLVIPLIYLFADYYLLSPKPEEQLRQRVKVAYFALTLLFLISAVLLGSFSIPTDVKNQTIHTIVTKPVEKYEIVLGRFLGFALLLAVELLLLTGLSLVYVTRGITPQASLESYRARQPLLADRLGFHGTKELNKGESVGREWDYRQYIGNVAPGDTKRQYGIWEFDSIPGALSDRQGTVPVEWSLDIFRTTKGEEKDQGVYCTFWFAAGSREVLELERLTASTGAYVGRRTALYAKIDQDLAKEEAQMTGEGGQKRQLSDADKAAIKAKIEEKRKALRGEANDKLADEFGLYVAAGTLVTDYHTQSLDVPAGLFRKLYAEQGKGGTGAPAMKILVSMQDTSGPQLLGMARRDLYVLAGEGWFWLNFIKGAIGIWFSAILLLAIALACSTYLSAIISLIAALFLAGAGLAKDFIQEQALGTAVGGGPFISAYRMANRQNMVMELDRSSVTVGIFTIFDEGFRWWLRRILDIFPDVTRYDLTTYVANGYDISWSQVLFADSLVPLLGYLIPWAVLAYYLMNSREIANPT